MPRWPLARGFVWARGLAGLLFLAATFPAMAQDAPPRGLLALSREVAPPLVLGDMDARVTDLTKLRGRWVMVHFWASWCGPCRREMPTLALLAQRFAGRPFALVLVNTAESDDAVFAFLASVAPELTTLMDRDGTVTARWQPRGLPSSFLVDPRGRVAYLALGGRDWTRPELTGFLETLLAETTP